MPELSLSFFGPGQILGPRSNKIALRGRKEFALLAYLAVEPESAHRRESLGELLWPEMGESEFRNNLRVTLSRLKNTLIQGGVDPLAIQRQTVQFRLLPQFEIDTQRFQQLIGEIDGHHHAELMSCVDCIPKILAAVDLYKGEFLQGFHVDDSYRFEDWVRFQQEYFRRSAIELLIALEDIYLLQEDVRGAMDATRRRLVLDPFQEDAHRQLMRLMVRNGESHAALVQYETCRHQLEKGLDVPPNEETIELYRQIRNGEISSSVQGDSVQIQTSENRLVSGRSGEPATPNREADNRQPQGIADGLEPIIDVSELPSIDTQTTHIKKATFEAQLTRWGTVPSQKLFGIDEISTELLAILTQEERPWIISIDGIGGIGKTSIARQLSRLILDKGRFDRIAWVSAKQEEFHSDSGIRPAEQPALEAEQMVTELLSQLSESSDSSGLAASGDAQAKRQMLIQKLKEDPALVVIDNLETAADYQAVVPILSQLAEPSKVLITSRLSLRAYADIYTQTLGELPEPDTIALIRHESTVRGLTILSEATDEHLQAIYQVVGGHPLALNLVLGQLSYLPLRQVLTGLQEARGERIEQLYSYIYWQAWQMLDDAGRQLFLTLPIVYNGTYGQLAKASLLDTDELSAALSQLIRLSLVQVAGDIMEPRYRLHRLTETFLMNEVLKWN